MGEVTLPRFLISLPKAIFVIARLVGPFSEKNCDRDLENAVRALRPRAAFSTLISQFFAIRTYFMLVAFSSPVKFSKIVFPVFRA